VYDTPYRYRRGKLTKDSSLDLNSLLVLFALLLNIFEPTVLHKVLGWWFFMTAAVLIPVWSYRYYLMYTKTEDELIKNYKRLYRLVINHRAFVHSVVLAFYLYFWWEWVIK
jgi:hypothetical protein